MAQVPLLPFPVTSNHNTRLWLHGAQASALGQLTSSEGKWPSLMVSEAGFLFFSPAPMLPTCVPFLWPPGLWDLCSAGQALLEVGPGTIGQRVISNQGSGMWVAKSCGGSGDASGLDLGVREPQVHPSCSASIAVATRMIITSPYLETGSSQGQSSQNEVIQASQL